MLNFIEEKLLHFHSCFSRTATFRWFVVAVIGLMVRTDFLGVTSTIRTLGIHPRWYESLLHFFRSDACSNLSLKKTWFRLLRNTGILYKFAGRNLLIGDGTKQPKEGYFMPGVKKLAQESETSSKPQFFFGHMFGGIGAVIGNGHNGFCIPLDLNIQDGLEETALWEGGNPENASSHIVQIVRNAYAAAETLGHSYLALDRYFLSVTALLEMNALNKEELILHIITRAKNSCVAYELPAPHGKHRGRPRKKGKAVKLTSLFTQRAADFRQGSVMMYGKTESVKYLCLDLLWGSGLYQLLRFVLVISSKGTCILVSSDLSLDPLAIIEAYALRTKIESTFRELKQQVGGLRYHFWTKAQPRLKNYKKTTEPDQLSGIVDDKNRRRILKTVEATERFIICSCIAMGLSQMIALTPGFAKTVRRHRYLRTLSKHKVSEATVLEYLRKNFFRLLYLNPHSEINRFILSLQFPDKCWEEEDFLSA